jgi:integrase
VRNRSLPPDLSTLPHGNGKRTSPFTLLSGSLFCGNVWVDTSHVFTSATAPGEHLREVTVSRAFKRLLNEASLPDIRFHDLRHTCATLLFSKGANPKVVQEMLGHSSVANTMDRYTHWIPSMGEQAAKMLEVALS